MLARNGSLAFTQVFALKLEEIGPPLRSPLPLSPDTMGNEAHRISSEAEPGLGAGSGI